MILVASPNKPFTYTAKNTARRQAIIIDYEPEIDKLYVDVAETAQSDLPTPQNWSREETLPFIRTVVGNVLRPLDDDRDLFQEGCDR